MNQVAQEIRDGLNFLLTRIYSKGTTMEVGAEHDVFYASITDGHMTSERICDIQSQMVLLGWSVNEDELLSFSHFT